MKHTLAVAAAAILFFGFQKSQLPFVGRWQLDIKNSKNLPESFKSVEEYTMDVQQRGDSVISVAGLKGSGQSVTFPQTVYMLSGKESFRDDTLRAVKRWYTSQWFAKDNQFIVSSRVNQRNLKTGQELRYTQMDVWEIKNDSTMKITSTQKFLQKDSSFTQFKVFVRAK